MPQRHHSHATSALSPVPISIFLHRPATTSPRDRGPGDWCGVQPADLTHLIRRLTDRGDLVVDLDQHSLVTRAARHLGRQPAHVHTDDNQTRLRPAPPARQFAGPHRRAGLVTARLPRPDAHSADLHDMTQAMHTWRGLLRPGGFLVAAMTDVRPDGGAVSHRTTVITAARAAGLYFRQEFLVLCKPLPEHEPRAMPDPVKCPPPALIDGHHDVIHLCLATFSTAPGGTHA